MSVGPAIAAVFDPLWGALAAAARLAARGLRVALLALQPLWEPLAYLACLYFIGAPGPAPPPPPPGGGGRGDSTQVLTSHRVCHTAHIYAAGPHAAALHVAGL